MEKLKKRWGLKTNTDVIAVFCTFAVNGSFIAYIGKILMDFFNLSPLNTSVWIYYPIKFILISIIYQITLPLVGWVFGKHKFFLDFVKKFLNRLGLSFIFSK